VIKTDFFNQYPGPLGPQVFGMIEVPGFVEFLTTSKTDFIRKGQRKRFEAMYGPLREEFRAWLADLGVRDSEVQDRNEATALERELRRILGDVPELAEFLGSWGRRQVLTETSDGSVEAGTHEGIQMTLPDGDGAGGDGTSPPAPGDEEGEAIVESNEGERSATPISRRARRGPRIAFSDRPDRIDLGWIESESVHVNTGHPSYQWTRPGSRDRRIHNVFAVASAVQRYLAFGESQPDLEFVDRMMAAWGRK
jgi:hypothetical protein